MVWPRPPEPTGRPVLILELKFVWLHKPKAPHNPHARRFRRAPGRKPRNPRHDRRPGHPGHRRRHRKRLRRRRYRPEDRRPHPGPRIPHRRRRRRTRSRATSSKSISTASKTRWATPSSAAKRRAAKKPGRVSKRISPRKKPVNGAHRRPREGRLHRRPRRRQRVPAGQPSRHPPGARRRPADEHRAAVRDPEDGPSARQHRRLAPRRARREPRVASAPKSSAS